MKQDILTELLQPIVEDMGYVYWGLEYQVRKTDALLRIYIDRPEGIGIEDCEKVSHEVSGMLDVEEPISMAYILEVSSPGMDRILFNIDQFEQFTGENVKINFNHKINDRRRIKGRILSVQDNIIKLDTDDGEVEVDFDTIMKARIIPDF